MNYNIHNIWKGNAPPKEEGNPLWGDPSCCHFDPSADGEKSVSVELNSNRFLTAFGMTRTNGSPLLNMRDGPRGRAPAIRFAMGNGLVTLNQKSSVLCGFSVHSVVKRKINHGECGEDTENTENYTLNPTKAFRVHCIAKKSGLAGGKGQCWKTRMLEYWNVILSESVPVRASGVEG